jgi:hypothetical protein
MYGGDPAGRRAATRAGHDPVAGSLAPTPTLSDAPIATYRMPELAVAVAVAVAGTLLGEAVGRDVGDRRAAGAAEHALTNAAEITMRTAISPFHIGTIVLPVKGHGDAWFRQGRQTDRREPRNAVPPR